MTISYHNVITRCINWANIKCSGNVVLSIVIEWLFRCGAGFLWKSLSAQLLVIYQGKVGRRAEWVKTGLSFPKTIWRRRQTVGEWTENKQNSSWRQIDCLCQEVQQKESTAEMKQRPHSLSTLFPPVRKRHWCLVPIPHNTVLVGSEVYPDC